MRPRHEKEAFVLAKIRKYLDDQKIFHWRNSVGAACIEGRWQHFGLPGSSDLLGVLPGGRFLAVEVKAEGGRLATAQSVFLEAIRSRGGCAIVARSIDDVEVVLGRQNLLFVSGPDR